MKNIKIYRIRCENIAKIDIYEVSCTQNERIYLVIYGSKDFPAIFLRATFEFSRNELNVCHKLF